MYQQLSIEIIKKLGEELNLPMIESLSEEERKKIDESDTDSAYSNYTTVLKSFYKGQNILNITIFDPYCGLFGRGRKALGSFNMNTMKWTKNSKLQTQLSPELKQLISNEPLTIELNPTPHTQIFMNTKRKEPEFKYLKKKDKSQKKISDYYKGN